MNSPITSQLSLATQLLQQGKLSEAKQAFEQVLRKDKNNADANHLLGVVFHQVGDNRKAEKYIRKAVKLAPKYWQAHNNLAVILRASEDFTGAKRVLANLVNSKPDYADAQSNYGIVLAHLGEQDKAGKHLNLALQLNPNHIDALYTLANLHKEAGQLEPALNLLQRVLSLHSNHLEAAERVAECMIMAGNYTDAIEALSNILKLKPTDPKTLGLRAQSNLQLGHLSKAYADLETALKHAREDTELRFQKANVLQQLRRYDEAKDIYESALESDPTQLGVRDNLIMNSNYSSHLSLEESLELHKSYARQLSAQQPTAKLQSLTTRAAGEKIQLGLVSGDFCFHSVAYFLMPLLKHLNKDQFSVTAYYTGLQEDEYTTSIQSHCETFKHVAMYDDNTLFQEILNDDIDVLIDLSGFTKGHRLPVFARRAAPVQITWLGYPNTTGLTSMDYRLSDACCDPLPETQAFYTEKLVHMPNGFLCYEPQSRAPEISDSPAHTKGYVTFGSFNNITKLTDKVLESWAQIMLRVPNSKLVLKSTQLADEGVKESIEKLFQGKGVDPSRLSLLARIKEPSGHLALYNQIDIALDPFPYNGTTTTFEAIWMGTPVITLKGDRHATRVGHSILTHLGLGELVSDSLDDYIEYAVRLANDTRALQNYKSTLRPALAESPLTDGAEFAQAFGTVILDLCHRTTQ